jgi:hypothetical protein
MSPLRALLARVAGWLAERAARDGWDDPRVSLSEGRAW